MRNIHKSIIGVLCLVGIVRGGDWTDFRGPLRNGIVKDANLPVEFGAKKNLVWKKALPGKAWSSPCIYQGKIYLTNAILTEDKLQLHTLCLDAKDPTKTVWDNVIFTHDATNLPRVHSKNSHASPTPIIHDSKLYVHFGHQGTACLDLEGKVLWKNNNYRYRPVHGNGGTPMLVDDALVFSCDGGNEAFVVAISRKTGKQLWKTPRRVRVARKFSFTTPQVIEVKGKKQIISPGSNVVCAYDPKNGNEIWRVEYNGYSVIPRPVYAHGLVYVCTGYGRPSLLAIDPTGQGNVTRTHVKWETKRAVPHTPSVLVVGDHLYMVSDRGIASCLEAKSGKKLWTDRITGNYSASPIYSGGKIYFLNESGVATVIEASPKKLTVLAKNDLEERSLASFAVADGSLFVRTAKHLYRFAKTDR